MEHANEILDISTPHIPLKTWKLWPEPPCPFTEKPTWFMNTPKKGRNIAIK